MPTDYLLTAIPRATTGSYMLYCKQYFKNCANANKIYHKKRKGWGKNLMMTPLSRINTDATWKRMSIMLLTRKTWKQKRNNYHYLDWYRDLNQNPRDSHLFILVIERKIFPLSLTRHFFKHKYTDRLQACQTAVVDCHCLKGPFVSKICDVVFFLTLENILLSVKKIQWAQIKSDQFTRVHGLQHSPLTKCPVSVLLRQSQLVTRASTWTSCFVWSTRIKWGHT